MDIALRNDDLTITAMADGAADRLNNTATIARNSYIHPDVIALVDMNLPDRQALGDASTPTRLRKAERAVMALLHTAG